MAGSNSSNEPIYFLPPIEEAAVPMAGLDLPLSAFAGRTRSVIEPIYPYPIPPESAVPLSGFPAPGALDAAVRNRIDAAGAQELSLPELVVLRDWMNGKSESDSATGLNWTADAVREARSGLLSRLRITFDSFST